MKMKTLETATIEEKQKNFHIVPISSLIISRLCRLDNEHKTVLELWAPVVYSSNISNKKSSLHKAVSLNDIKLVRSLVKEMSKKQEEFKQDQLGWTPLHCAASSEEKLPVSKLNTKIFNF